MIPYHWIQIIVFASHNILTEELTPRGYLLLQLIRSYLELDMYASLTVHTDTMLAAGRKEMLIFDKLLKVSISVSVLWELNN